ncbi:crotonase/enoyl-CoA hydratase family protein [Parasphingorhabdus litoris]|uniref:Crotonase/enoyl-CoA hydratase family protein n=1 Tax=Parasphingorhabdus litoris TaxID=394733 RepID=A0ABP3KC28_9SPHN|nr:crotonase/enoyl-CoA hydratase family protein [Parasphingorhabdus litoris]
MSITVRIDEDIAHLAMDDGKANAINPDWMADFVAKFDEAESGAKAIILSGREGVFSGGFDLKWLAAEGAARSGELLDQASRMLIKIYGSRVPVIAACNGHAIAMGAFLLLACDTRIGAKGAFRYGANETINNMNLPVFAVELPKARLDGRKLTQALIQSQLYEPAEALDVGYIDILVDAEQVMETAKAQAELLSKLAGRAYGANKLAVRKPTLDRIEAAIGTY